MVRQALQVMRGWSLSPSGELVGREADVEGLTRVLYWLQRVAAGVCASTRVPPRG